MSGLLIALCAIILSFAYPIVLSLFKINKSILQFTVIYAAIIIVLTGIVSYINQDNLTRGDYLIMPIALVGVVVRIGAYYFRRTTNISHH